MTKQDAREWEEQQLHRRALSIEEAVHRGFSIRSAISLQYQIFCSTEQLRQAYLPFFENHLDSVTEGEFGQFLYETVASLNSAVNHTDEEIRAFVSRIVSIKKERFFE